MNKRRRKKRDKLQAKRFVEFLDSLLGGRKLTDFMKYTGTTIKDLASSTDMLKAALGKN